MAVACSFPLLSLHRHRELLVANAVALALCLGLTLGLVPSLASKGAAIGAASAEYSLAIVLVVLMTRARADLRPRATALVPLLVAAAATVALLLVHGLHPVIQVAAASALYFGALAIMGRIPRELIDALPGFMGRRA